MLKLLKPHQASIFTFGCFYRDQGPKFMSMYGSVTDAQVFSRELSDEEMIEITSCKYVFINEHQSILYFRKFPKGDIISWEREAWNLTTPWNSSEMEILDFEKDVCNMKEKALFMVPHRFNHDESHHICKKLSGRMVDYVDQNQFDDILHYLSLSTNMKSEACTTPTEDGRQILAWTGGNDLLNEGKFETWSTREDIQVTCNKSSTLVFFT